MTMSSYVNAGLTYAFSPSAGTISFAGNQNFNPRWLRSITNQTRNTFIYLPGVANSGGSWDVATNTVLTLQANVSSHASNDLLLITYDDQQNALANIQALLSGQGQSVFNLQQELLLRIILKLDEVTDVLKSGFGVYPQTPTSDQF
jgi:hypothetical protein